MTLIDRTGQMWHSICQKVSVSWVPSHALWINQATAVFQALVNDVLRDMQNKFVFRYWWHFNFFPWFGVSSETCQTSPHVSIGESLFVKAEKFEFLSPTVSFLGFIISEGEIKVEPEKMWAVLDWPTPGSRKDVQHFLGFAHFYRKFIRNISFVAAPLHALTSQKNHSAGPHKLRRPFSTWRRASPRHLSSLYRTQSGNS